MTAHDDELRELVAGIAPDNRHAEVDFGQPVGREARPPCEDSPAPAGD
jgi:hypothetical protein